MWPRPLRGKPFRSQSFHTTVSFQLVLFLIPSLTSMSVLQFRRTVLWHVYERASMILAPQQSSYLFKWTTNRLCIQDFPQKQNLELHYVDFFSYKLASPLVHFSLSLSLRVREMFPYTRIQLLQPFRWRKEVNSRHSLVHIAPLHPLEKFVPLHPHLSKSKKTPILRNSEYACLSKLISE